MEINAVGDVLDKSALFDACGDDTEVTKSFTYLRSIMHNDGGCYQEVTMLGLAHNFIKSLNLSKWSCLHLSKRTKTKFFHSLMLPLLLYACKTRAVNCDEGVNHLQF